jgi:hypothetical protein
LPTTLPKGGVVDSKKLLFPDFSVCEICQDLDWPAKSRTRTASGNCPFVTNCEALADQQP